MTSTAPTMDLTYISSHDGTKNTLLLSENLDATRLDSNRGDSGRM